jgi:prephenate dehydrogenase
LFNNKLVILTPTKNTNAHSVTQVRELWETLGAKVEVMDSKTHDDLLAMTSHTRQYGALSSQEYF